MITCESEDLVEPKEELPEDHGWHQRRPGPFSEEPLRAQAQRQRTGWGDLTILASDDVGNGDAPNL